MAHTETTDLASFSIACAIGASLAFSISDITVRSFSASLPLAEVVLFRSFFGLAFILMIFARGQGLGAALRTRRPLAHAARGLFVVISNVTYFAGLAALPLAEASAIFFVAPLLITALSAVILREHVGPLRWLALAVGMVGVLLIIKPGSISFQWAVLLPALSALAYAGMHTMTRNMGLSESALTLSIYIQLSFVVFCSVMGLVFGRGDWAGTGHPAAEFLLRAWVWPTPVDFGLFALAGAASATGGYLIGQAYRCSAAGLVAPFEYTALVLAAFWGFAIWGEVPGAVSGLGIALILGSGVFVALRERARRLPPSAKRASGRR
ncbi:DMT family transporter [Defluviimonas sp. WL0024]|uniref:DMT family transporter n=2 Tax=Albidovulum TaxID=205889 RepID=A0ABT3IYK2_9RHOB|nr:MULTISPECIES: DMT family transporter [Defluviimonas]MCU9848513.1 DMT family transporter [Defluviimonas sp. WL0024]MCW3780503.1 DMT family transporter [Defluviimonas salinarum]